jgi:methionyl-tRNA formyltransferase
MKIGILGRSEVLLNSAKLLNDFGYEIAWIVTAPSENYYLAHESDFEDLAKTLGCAFYLESNIENPLFLNKLKSFGADLVVSVNWPKVISEQVCNSFSYGIFNAHLGDLPRYRGNACPNWAIINGENRIGLCIHQMEPGSLDSGPIYCKDYLDLEGDTYISDVYDWARVKIPSMFVDLIPKIMDKSFKPEYQSKDPSTWLRCYPRRPTDSQIQWNADSVMIDRLVRASSRPFAGAYSFLEGVHRLNIWRAEVFDHPGHYSALPGQLMFLDNGDPIVACGKGALKINEYEIVDQSKSVQLVRMRARLIFVSEH